MVSSAIHDTPELESRPFLGNTYLLSGSALCGGRAYALLERFFRMYAVACGKPDCEQYEILNILAAQGMKEKDALQVSTMFCGTRENTHLRGSICNISDRNFTPANLAAGFLTDMVLELYHLYQKMPDRTHTVLIASGNAARKNLVLQKILSSVFKMPLKIPLHKEEAALGAAMYGALATRIVENIGDVQSCILYEGEKRNTPDNR